MSKMKVLALFGIFVIFALAVIYVRQIYFPALRSKEDHKDSLSTGFSEFVSGVGGIISQAKDEGQAIKAYIDQISQEGGTRRLSSQEIQILEERLAGWNERQNAMLAIQESIKNFFPKDSWQVSGQVFDALLGVGISDFSIRISGASECQEKISSKKVLHFFPTTGENEILQKTASLDHERLSPRCAPKLYATTTDYLILDGCSNDFQCEDAEALNQALQTIFKNL